MKSLQYKKLWLVSEHSREAFSINFHPQMTLIVGKNHTGKSTLVKHIFRTLGCETLGKSDRWDASAVSVLSFNCDGTEYLAYRRANVFALKNGTTGQVRATTSYSEWSSIVAELFDFRLLLQTHQDKLKQATPPYLFLPYYIDQDGGWAKPWNSFDRLSQFAAGWKKIVISYVTGQRPNEYFKAKLELSLAKTDRNDLEHELGVVQTALARVKKSLPKSSIRLDHNAFRQEINDLLRDATIQKNEQESLRAKVFEQASTKQSLIAQLQMAKSSLRDIEGDLKYLTETKPESTLLCPTCGVEHENAFPVRYELVEDSTTMRSIIGELETELSRLEEGLASNYAKLNRLKARERDIEKTMQAKKGDLRLRDVVESQSAEVIRSAFSKDIDMLRNRIDRRDEDLADLKEKVDQFDLPERTKALNEYYSERMELFASELGLQELGEGLKKKPDAPFSARGSAIPRSILAYQFAILHTAREKGDAKLFPVVVDSPNQQGQDSEHLALILKFIAKRVPSCQQIILSVEEDPGLTFTGDTVTLTKPFGLLSQEHYEPARVELQDFIIEIQREIDERLTRPGNVASDAEDVED